MNRADGSGNAVGETTIEFLRRAVEKYADRDALLFKPAFRYLRWSYSRLWDESGRVATLLQRRGLTKGNQAILWGPNSPHWVLIFFGCLRAGVIVVPLDLRSTPDYVERVVSKTEPKLAFTSRFTPKGDVNLGVPEVTFEEMEAAIAGLPQPEHVDIEPDDLAEIMFTSGTTGDPKGVMLTHKNLTANIAGVSQYISCDPSSRLLSILPLSHMYEQMGGLFMTLHYGASVTYPTSRQPTVLARTMRERKITIMLLVPQGLELLMNGIEREVARQGKEALWGKLLQAAERTPFRLRRHLFRRVHKQFGGKLDFIVSGGGRARPGTRAEVGADGRQDRAGLRGHRGIARHQQSHHMGTASRLDRQAAAQRGGQDQRRGGDTGAWGQHHSGLLARAGGDRQRIRWRLVPDRRPGLFRRRGIPAHPGPGEGHDRAAERSERLPGGHPSSADEASAS